MQRSLTLSLIFCLMACNDASQLGPAIPKPVSSQANGERQDIDYSTASQPSTNGAGPTNPQGPVTDGADASAAGTPNAGGEPASDTPASNPVPPTPPSPVPSPPSPAPAPAPSAPDPVVVPASRTYHVIDADFPGECDENEHKKGFTDEAFNRFKNEYPAGVELFLGPCPTALNVGGVKATLVNKCVVENSAEVLVSYKIYSFTIENGTRVPVSEADAKSLCDFYQRP